MIAVAPMTCLPRISVVSQVSAVKTVDSMRTAFPTVPIYAVGAGIRCVLCGKSWIATLSS
jgi:hypothetical protein